MGSKHQAAVERFTVPPWRGPTGQPRSKKRPSHLSLVIIRISPFWAATLKFFQTPSTTESKPREPHSHEQLFSSEKSWTTTPTSMNMELVSTSNHYPPVDNTLCPCARTENMAAFLNAFAGVFDQGRNRGEIYRDPYLRPVLRVWGDRGDQTNPKYLYQMLYFHKPVLFSKLLM